MGYSSSFFAVKTHFKRIFEKKQEKFGRVPARAATGLSAPNLFPPSGRQKDFRCNPLVLRRPIGRKTLAQPTG
jgi:hypothetical protein